MKIKRLPDGQLRYCYEAPGGDIAFEFSLLSEVGEPWQRPAKSRLQDLRDRGFVIRYCEPVEGHPHYSDTARLE